MACASVCVKQDGDSPRVKDGKHEGGISCSLSHRMVQFLLANELHVDELAWDRPSTTCPSTTETVGFPREFVSNRF